MLTRIKDVFEINPKNKASDNIQAGFVPMASIHDGYSNKFHYDVKQWGEIKSGFTHFADGDIAGSQNITMFGESKIYDSTRSPKWDWRRNNRTAHIQKHNIDS